MKAVVEYYCGAIIEETFPKVILYYCIPAEDLLPQRKHTRSRDEDKSYSTTGKLYPNLYTYFTGVK